MNRILLTGSGGFIGKNLKKYLSEKFILLTPRSFELDLTKQIDVQNYFLKNDIDTIIHCASTGGVRGVADAETTLDDNLSMVKNILKYKKHNSKVILFGSGAMYDKSRNLHKVKEDDIGKFIPQDLYGKSKYLISQKIKDRDDVLMLNIFACYGYDEKPTRFPSYAIDRVLSGMPVEINQNVVFDYLFVEDMQKIVEYFISNPYISNIINITPSKSVSLLEISNIISKFSKNEVQIILKNDKLNNEYTGSNERLLQNIPNFEFTDIKVGLRKLYDYKKGQLSIKGEI